MLSNTYIINYVCMKCYAQRNCRKSFMKGSLPLRFLFGNGIIR